MSEIKLELDMKWRILVFLITLPFVVMIANESMKPGYTFIESMLLLSLAIVIFVSILYAFIINKGPIVFDSDLLS